MEKVLYKTRKQVSINEPLNKSYYKCCIELKKNVSISLSSFIRNVIVEVDQVITIKNTMHSVFKDFYKDNEKGTEIGNDGLFINNIPLNETIIFYVWVHLNDRLFTHDVYFCKPRVEGDLKNILKLVKDLKYSMVYYRKLNQDCNVPFKKLDMKYYKNKS